MVINMYIAPGWGQMSPWGPFFFSESLIFSPTAHFLQDFHFKWHFKSFPYSKCIGDLCWPCRKKGQGHHRVMIYIYIVVLEPSMLHAKFLWNRSTGSGEEDFWRVFTIYGHCGHIGHVTWIIYIHIDNPFLFMLHIKFGFDWPTGFRGDDVWILW